MIPANKDIVSGDDVMFLNKEKGTAILPFLFVVEISRIEPPRADAPGGYR